MHIAFTNALPAALLGFVISGCALAPDAAMAGPQPGMQHAAGTMHGGGGMMSMGPMVGCPGATESVDARLASLHSALRIAGAQEAPWATYAEAYRRSAASMGMGAMGGMGSMGGMGAMAAMPLPQRLQHHETMMSTHLRSLQDLRAAITPLYASLSAEQKAIADAMACDRPMQERR